MRYYKPMDVPITNWDKFSKDQCPKNEIEWAEMKGKPFDINRDSNGVHK